MYGGTEEEDQRRTNDICTKTENKQRGDGNDSQTVRIELEGVIVPQTLFLTFRA